MVNPFNNFSNFAPRHDYSNYQNRAAKAEISNFISQCEGVFSYPEMDVLLDDTYDWRDEQVLRSGMKTAYEMGYTYDEVAQGANELRHYLGMLDGNGGDYGRWDPWDSGNAWPHKNRNGYDFGKRYGDWMNIFEFPPPRMYENIWAGDDYGNYDKALDRYAERQQKSEAYAHFGRGAGDLVAGALKYFLA